MIYQAILGLLSNRIRGYGIKIFFINQDWINAYLFGFCFMQQWWHLLVLWIGMLGGASTGWSEFIGGVRGYYGTPPSQYTWISKILVIKDQWTCFLWGCMRAFIWVLPIYVAFLICGDNKWWLFLTIPLFYGSYRLGYLLRKDGDSTELGEMIWGALFWATCTI
jgi:hypothetical protein